MNLYRTVYVFIVTYRDGQGTAKTAKVVAKAKDIPEGDLLQAAMDKYGDAFAQEYVVKLFAEERKLSLFDIL